MSSEQAATFPWMNNDYFKSILSKYEGHDNLQLSDFNINTGANKGENFARFVLIINKAFNVLNPYMKFFWNFDDLFYHLQCNLSHST